MANLPEQQAALNAFSNLRWSACLILAFEVDLTYCMQMVDGDRTNVYPALRTGRFDLSLCTANPAGWKLRFCLHVLTTHLI